VALLWKTSDSYADPGSPKLELLVLHSSHGPSPLFPSPRRLPVASPGQSWRSYDKAPAGNPLVGPKPTTSAPRQQQHGADRVPSGEVSLPGKAIQVCERGMLHTIHAYVRL
jgi:hypothetical protein